MTTPAAAIATHLERSKLLGAGLPLARLADALERVRDAYASGGMGSDYRDGSVEELLAVAPPAWARSVWVVAVPSPLLRYRFSLGGVERTILLPAMYLYSIPMQKAETALAEAHALVGGQTEWAWLPLRILAAAAGLGEFGRNNMLYFRDWGSFPWMTGFFSSVEVPDVWSEPRRMARCETCGACLKACPTGSLAANRDLMRSDRCLNYATEYPGRCAGWFDLSMQNELLGCVACQRICPANGEQRDWIEDGPIFSEEETAALLRVASGGEMSASLAAKFGGDDLQVYFKAIARRVAREYQGSPG